MSGERSKGRYLTVLHLLQTSAPQTKYSSTGVSPKNNLVVEKELLTNYIQLAMVVLGKASFYRFPYNFSQLFCKREQAQIAILRPIRHVSHVSNCLIISKKVQKDAPHDADNCSSSSITRFLSFITRNQLYKNYLMKRCRAGGVLLWN